jgi:hypothetical protein
MNTMTRWIDYWNRKVRKLTIVDLKLVQVASMAAILVVVKLAPQLVSLSIWWFVAVFAVCILRPAYVLWIQDDAVGGKPL